MAHPPERVLPVPASSLVWRIVQTIVPCLSPTQGDLDHYEAATPQQHAAAQPLALPLPIAPVAVAPQPAPAHWFNRLMTTAQKMDLVDASGNLYLEVYRDYLAEDDTSISVPDMAVSSFLTAMHKAQNIFVPDRLEDVMEIMGSDTARIDLCMEAPLVKGVYSSATGRTYWAHQCMKGENNTILCPFSRTPLSDLIPNKDFDILFKAAFPTAYHAACNVKVNSLKEHTKRVAAERKAAAEQARLNAQPINQLAEEQQLAAIQQAYERGMHPEEIARRIQFDLDLVRAMLNIPEPDQEYLAAIAASLEEPDWGFGHDLPIIQNA